MPRLAALAVGLLATLAGAAPGLADTAPALREQIASLVSAERAAILDLFSAESALASAERVSAESYRLAARATVREKNAQRHALLIGRSLAAG